MFLTWRDFQEFGGLWFEGRDRVLDRVDSSSSEGCWHGRGLVFQFRVPPRLVLIMIVEKKISLERFTSNDLLIWAWVNGHQTFPRSNILSEQAMIWVSKSKPTFNLLESPSFQIGLVGIKGLTLCILKLVSDTSQAAEMFLKKKIIFLEKWKFFLPEKSMIADRNGRAQMRTFSLNWSSRYKRVSSMRAQVRAARTGVPRRFPSRRRKNKIENNFSEVRYLTKSVHWVNKARSHIWSFFKIIGFLTLNGIGIILFVLSNVTSIDKSVSLGQSMTGGTWLFFTVEKGFKTSRMIQFALANLIDISMTTIRILDQF